MAVSGADTSLETRVLSTTLQRYGASISNEIKRNDSVVEVFGAKERIEVVTGGNRAFEVLDTQENPNFAFRSMYVNSAKARSETRLIAKYGWATIDGIVAINRVEQAMNAGSSKIFDIAQADIENAKNTIIRKVADALRATTPGANDPESVVSIIPDTATASQTTSTGELSRSTYSSFWRSQYDATAMVLSTAAGLASLEGFYLQSCAKSSTSKKEMPDFALTNGTLYAVLSATFSDNLPRVVKIGTGAAPELSLGVDGIKIFNALMVADPSMAAGDIRFINTNYMKLQVLRMPGMENIGDKPQSLPFVFDPFADDLESPNKTAFGILVFALTCSSLQRQGIATTCS